VIVHRDPLRSLVVPRELVDYELARARLSELKAITPKSTLATRKSQAWGVAIAVAMILGWIASALPDSRVALAGTAVVLVSVIYSGQNVLRSPNVHVKHKAAIMIGFAFLLIPSLLRWVLPRP
jgi:hypothetical protein